MEHLLLQALLIPFAGALLIALTGKRPNLREATSILTSLLLLRVIIQLIGQLNQDTQLNITLLHLMPGITVQLNAEPLGGLFALIASSLWILTTLYAISYMRQNKETNQTRFFTCFALSIGAAIGIALSANLITLFIFYEILTLSTYPLVTHKANHNAKIAGRKYLGILFTTSICFLLLATIWTYTLAGTGTFTPGGILPDNLSNTTLAILYTLFIFGIGKAALMPFHRWLPAAMVAPTPVSALLHAVAVVKAGVFTVLKITIYIFGIDRLNATGASDWIIAASATTIILSSLIALSKDNLKARLAYSTISQLSYITLGASMATAAAITGATLHIAMHAIAKITLFFCAGAIYTASKKTDISTMDGLGRRMPLTYTAFFIASCSIIGLPPLGGTWSKWYLLLGTVDRQQIILMATLLISSLLNVAYLIPIVARGFFSKPSHDQQTIGWREAPPLMLIPLTLTAISCILLFILIEPLLTYIQKTPLT